jgi:hypothetical protein
MLLAVWRAPQGQQVGSGRVVNVRQIRKVGAFGRAAEEILELLSCRRSLQHEELDTHRLSRAASRILLSTHSDQT